MASTISFHGDNYGLAVGVNEGTITFTSINNEADRKCIQALRCPNSRAVKNRLTQEKDQMRPVLIKWVFQSDQYQAWQNGHDVGFLWIKGGAGKGKTMMSIGIIDELSRLRDDSSGKPPIVVYFFCQNADDGLSTTEAIIKGLILQLIHQDESLIKCLRENWDAENNSFIKNMASWSNLWDMFWDMLDQCDQSIYIVIDGLDECRDEDLDRFLHVVIRNGLENPQKMKWLLTSRPLDIAERVFLTGNDQTLISLELNLGSVAASVETYVQEKVKELDRRARYGDILRQKIEYELVTKAEGTFLWVSLVCKTLETVSSQGALSAIQTLPAGLPSLYSRVFDQLHSGDPIDVRRSMILLQLMNSTPASQKSTGPWNLEALASIYGFVPEGASIKENEDTVRALVDRCASFLKIHERTIRFAHQSARDFFLSETGKSLLDSQEAFGHYEIALGYVSFLDRNLKINLLDFPKPDSSLYENIDGKKMARTLSDDQAALLRTVEHAATHWAPRLLEAQKENYTQSQSIDKKSIKFFLRIRILEWIEALCCSMVFVDSRTSDTPGTYYIDSYQVDLERPMRHRKKVNTILSPIEELMQDDPESLNFVQDAKNLLFWFHYIVERYPLQIYSAALIFSPQRSLVRNANLDQIPKWLRNVPQTPENWADGACRENAISPSTCPYSWQESRMSVTNFDNDLVVTPHYQSSTNQKKTLSSGLGPLSTVAWSPDGERIASVEDGIIKLWNPTTGRIEQTINEEVKSIKTIGVSHDNKIIAFSCSEDSLIRLWNSASRQTRILTAHTAQICALSFSSDDLYIISGSEDATVWLWDASTGESRKKLSGHSERVGAVAFSSDGKYIASGSDDRTVRLWGAMKGNHIKTFQRRGQPGKISGVAFSPDGKRLAACSRTSGLQLYDISKYLKPSKVFGHAFSSHRVAFEDEDIFRHSLNAIRFSSDNRYIATNYTPIWLDAGGFNEPKVNDDTSDLEFSYSKGWICVGKQRLLCLVDIDTCVSCGMKGDKVDMAFYDGRVVTLEVDQTRLGPV